MCSRPDAKGQIYKGRAEQSALLHEGVSVRRRWEFAIVTGAGLF